MRRKQRLSGLGAEPTLTRSPVPTSVCLSVVTSSSQGKEVVHDLGVYLDSELSLKQHITRVANSCFHHLRRLRQIRRSVEKDVMIQLVVAFVLSRIDYCNAVLLHYHSQPSSRYSVHRMQLPDLFLVSGLTTTSLRLWRSYTGCRCSSASNSNCAS